MINSMLIVLGVIFLLQLLFFVYAVINKTDKVTDLSYGLTFIIASLLPYFLVYEYSSFFKLLLVLLVVVWGLRLGIFLFIRVVKTKRDKRFDGIREEPLKFASFWILQAVSVFIILLPTIYTLLLDRETSLGWFSYIGFLIAILGIAIESIADIQKFVFKNIPENAMKWISTGLWKYSRHPNYLGEILMWVGVYIYVLPYLNDLALLTIVSPIYISILLLFVSGIPKLEKEYEKRYEGNSEYEKYVRSTGRFLPKIFLKKD